MTRVSLRPQGEQMEILFIGSVGVITRDRAEGRRLFVDSLRLPLKTAEGTEFLFSQGLEGSKYFGVWPLTEAAKICFGRDRWPSDRPVPQFFIEFELGDPDKVARAAAELESKGYTLLHGPRKDPWGQTVARMQTQDGAIIGLSYVPWMHRRRKARAGRTHGPHR